MQLEMPIKVVEPQEYSTSVVDEQECSNEFETTELENPHSEISFDDKVTLKHVLQQRRSSGIGNLQKLKSVRTYEDSIQIFITDHLLQENDCLKNVRVWLFGSCDFFSSNIDYQPSIDNI